jgi:F-type H+-transporting ATPase subunit b
MHFDETFWVGLAFLTIIALLYKKIAQFLLAALDKKSQNIESELREAVKLRKEAQEIRDSYYHKYEEAVQHSKELIANAEIDIEKMLHQANLDIKASTKNNIALTCEKIKEREVQIIDEMRNKAVVIAFDGAKDILISKLDAKKNDQLISESAKKIKNM